MSKDIAFSSTQVEQLTELLDHQRQSITADLIAYVDRRLIEERSVTRQIVQSELGDVRERLDSIDEKLAQFFATEDEDIRAVSRRLTQLKAQVAALEASVAKLQPAA